MELVCPICNRLFTFLLKCPACGSQMESVGTLQDFLDSYSPNLPIDTVQYVDGVSQVQCLHIFSCKSCNYDKRIPVDKIQI